MEKIPLTEDQKKMVNTEIKDINSYLSGTGKEIISVRLLNVLRPAGINILADLQHQAIKDIISRRQLGTVCMIELINIFKAHDLSLILRRDGNPIQEEDINSKSTFPIMLLHHQGEYKVLSQYEPMKLNVINFENIDDDLLRLAIEQLIKEKRNIEECLEKEQKHNIKLKEEIQEHVEKQRQLKKQLEEHLKKNKLPMIQDGIEYMDNELGSFLLTIGESLIKNYKNIRFNKQSHKALLKQQLQQIINITEKGYQGDDLYKEIWAFMKLIT